MLRMSSSEKPAEARRSKPRRGLICASWGTRSANVVSHAKGRKERKWGRASASAYLGLRIVVILALGEMRADGALQQPGHCAWRCGTGRSRCHQRVGAVFVLRRGALLALLERAEPQRQLRAVSEQTPGVYEA